MSSVADADRTYLSGVTFGAATLPTQIALGNGTVQNFDFNERLQMKSQDLKRGTEVLQKYEYGFGELNPQSQLRNNGKLESVVSYIGSQKQWTQKFSYDSVGRLKEARETRGDNEALSYKQVFEFDRFGNLFRKATSNPTTGQDTPIVFTPIEPGDIDPAKNRFTSASGTAYNDNGQVVTDGKFRNLGYGYDANGRMVRASQTNQPDAVSVYDALGNRVAEKVNDVWQFVIYDAFGKLVAEYGGTVPQDEGGVKFYLQDWQGSVRAGLNAAGYVKSRTDHQAFGEPIASGIGLRTTAQGFGAPSSNRQGYGLTEKDSTELNHTWFRKNENRAGRWTSPDPYNGSASVGNPQSWNRYSYVESQPTNYVDPSGLDDEVPIFRMEVHTWASTFASWWWIFFGVSPVRNGGYIGEGGGGSFGDKCDPDFFADDFIWKVRNLEITGEDLNYAARVVFAEASSIWIPTNGPAGAAMTIRPQSTDEYDAMASVLYLRLGEAGYPSAPNNTFFAVANAPNQFESVTTPGKTAKFASSAPGNYQNLSVGGLQEVLTKDKRKLFNFVPGECDNLIAAVQAIRRLVNSGPQFGFRFNRGDTSGRGTVIGGSRFW